MLASTLKLAVKVLLRRKFFTGISLFGISFTLLVLMLAAAQLDQILAARPPESRRERILAISSTHMIGPAGDSGSGAGYKVLDRFARDLPGAERMSIILRDGSVRSYRKGVRTRSEIRRTDAELWKILDFQFLEGGPFTETDVREARFVAVINQRTRDRLLGGGPALGKTLQLGDQNFQVVGVVPDVPKGRRYATSDVWVPITTAKETGWRDDLLGSCIGLVLARSRADIPAIKEEMRSRLERRFESPDPKRWNRLVAPIESQFEKMARDLFDNRNEQESHPERLWALIALAALLFMLLPTVNLVNLNVSRILERASEIGVRKAFGASSRTLVSQFLIENVLLTLIGGVIGLVASLLVLQALTSSGAFPYGPLRLHLGLFLQALAIALVFGVLSGVYPAWRMSRLNPAVALKGGER
jgi:putative ABC transport system permease protein